MFISLFALLIGAVLVVLNFRGLLVTADAQLALKPWDENYRVKDRGLDRDFVRYLILMELGTIPLTLGLIFTGANIS